MNTFRCFRGVIVGGQQHKFSTARVCAFLSVLLKWCSVHEDLGPMVPRATHVKSAYEDTWGARGLKLSFYDCIRGPSNKAASRSTLMYEHAKRGGDAQTHTHALSTRLVEALVAGDEVAVPQQSDGHLRGQLEAVLPPLLSAPSHQARVVRCHQDVLERRWCRFVQRLQREKLRRER